jgi:glycosyl hydrolase family 92/ricin-type beta-trefoil lectin protein
VRQIQDQIWTDTPSGLGDGNDDLGTMSAWFVWSALGMYPMTPGTPTLALGSPLFTQAVITLPSGNTLTIDGNGASSTAAYVQSASWNGAAWDDAYAPAAAITSGGTLSYTLGTSPDTSWAAAGTDAPPSYSGNTVAPPGPRTGPVTSGVRASLCLDDKSSSTTPGNPVQIYTCNGGDNQAWTLTPDGTISTLGLCLDVHRDGKTSGAKIDLYTCNGGGGQQWTEQANGTLVNPESRLCLNDPGSSAKSGTRLELGSCNTSGAERWGLPPAPATQAGQITSAAGTGLCAADKGGVTTDQNPIQIASCASGSAQDWTVEPDHTLRVLGKCMDVVRSGTTAGTLIDLYGCNGTGSQQWQMVSGGTLVNPESGLCLDAPSASPGAQLELATCDGSSGESWTMPQVAAATRS